MGQPVFIKVLGFSDVERHAINSLFRLSQERAVSYALWQPESRAAPQLLLMDGQSHEAGLELAAGVLQARDLAAQGKAPVKAIWVAAQGVADAAAAHSPGIWRSFPRPVHWPDIVHALDELFTPAPAPAPALDLDFDLDASPAAVDAPLTAENDAENEAELTDAHDAGQDDPPTQPGLAVQPRVLLVNASLEKRYYLRSVLALSGWTVADEAANFAQATDLLRAASYALVILELDLPERSSWRLLAEIRQLQAQPPVLLAITAQGGLLVHWRAWLQGIQATWRDPIDSRLLHRKLLALDEALHHQLLARPAD